MKVWLSCLFFAVAAFSQPSPISIELVRPNFASFLNSDHPGNRIGYRFFEHTPLSWGSVPLSEAEAGINPDKIDQLVMSVQSRPGLFTYSHDIAADDHWVKQKWTYYMVPVNDGIDMLMIVETFGNGLPEYYGVQQCFRMSGENNPSEWRKEIALTPAFSEYDLWQKEGSPKTSLTSVLRNGAWENLPAQKEAVGARTPMGLAADQLRSSGTLPEKVGPYEAIMEPPIDSPLILRTDRDKNWVCGIFWENTAHVTNHHPADCLHPIINIGNIPPFSQKAFSGKIYWFKGSMDEAASKLAEDFRPAPGTLKIAACQFPVGKDVEQNAAWIKTQMRKARLAGAQLVHFPECALSGYGGADWHSQDELDWTKIKEQTREIMALAKSLDLWVLLGSSHQLSGDNKPHNSLYVIDNTGVIIDRYDKRFCTGGDLKYYSPGDHFVTFELNGVKAGLLICYDVRFPELYRQYRKLDVDVIFQSFYNARHRENCIHPKIMPVTAQARAGTNSFYMSLTNSCAPYSWPCHFITPDGLITGKLPANQPGILYGEIDANKQFYDASRPFRMDAINGKLNSGETVEDARSKDRKSL